MPPGVLDSKPRGALVDPQGLNRSTHAGNNPLWPEPVGACVLGVGVCPSRLVSFRIRPQAFLHLCAEDGFDGSAGGAYGVVVMPDSIRHPGGIGD